jgi:hypothetical protein
MVSTGVVFLLVGGLMIAASGGAAAQDNCPLLLKRQEEQCQQIAERLQSLCPSGEASRTAEKRAECGGLVDQLKNQCTRKPCGAAPRRAKAKKGKSKPARTKVK